MPGVRNNIRPVLYINVFWDWILLCIYFSYKYICEFIFFYLRKNIFIFYKLCKIKYYFKILNIK